MTQPSATSISQRSVPLLGSLEIGRFVAASVVVLTHFFPDVPRFARHPDEITLGQIHMPGAIAVQYFFVLSGFVMMTAHRADFGQLARVPIFWWRRACRIYPMYWVALGIMFYYLLSGLTPLHAFQLISLQPSDIWEEFVPRPGPCVTRLPSISSLAFACCRISAGHCFAPGCRGCVALGVTGVAAFFSVAADAFSELDCVSECRSFFRTI